MASSASASSSPVARTTPPTAVAAAATTEGHHHHIRSTDPGTAAVSAASSSSSTHPVSSGGAQPPSSTHTDPNSTNGGNVDPNRKRRGNLPKSVTSVLKSWLVQNAIHPYPTEEEKMRLSEATQLSMNQISNWFINARRRILQPILHEAAAAAVAGTDAPVENVLIVRKGCMWRWRALSRVILEEEEEEEEEDQVLRINTNITTQLVMAPIMATTIIMSPSRTRKVFPSRVSSLPPIQAPQPHNQSHPQPILSS
ncbi:hypothetical protein BGX30_003994 [Mortierella sp. GBA39]|nr:hypothetical protein BGX30_003994 [Mortierella sp. GBA39]